MIRLVVVASAAIGLILFVAFVVSRLLRTRTRGMSIRMQVFLALALIVGTFAFGLGLMVIDRVEARAVRLASQAAGDEATTLAGLLEGEIERTGQTIDEVAALLDQEALLGADLRLELLGADGRLIFPAREASARGRPGTVSVDAPIEVHGQKLGAVRVVKPTVVMRRLLLDFAPTVLVITLVLGAAAALAAAWIGRAIAAPIESLGRFAQRVSVGERTASPPAVFGREVTRLIGAIDSMRRQLEGRPFAETFAADLSHELKNPVAAIRASAEVLEEGALDEPEEARRFVSRILEASRRIERLLKDLLSLARVEAHGVETLQTVDLKRVAEQARESLDERGSRIEIDSSGESLVHGQAVWLTRMLSNLLDNALTHGRSDGAITISITSDGQNLVLRVTSPGAIQPHVRRQLFRRFVTTRSDRGGTGLGLAIARAVAESHGGELTLASEGPPTVQFRVILPIHWRPAAEVSDGPDAGPLPGR